MSHKVFTITMISIIFWSLLACWLADNEKKPEPKAKCECSCTCK